MTIDEAIKHAEEVAETKEKQVERGDWEKGSLTEKSCIACANEHRQLAEWLKDYKRMKEQDPCDDCISRQAAIDAIDALYLDGDSSASYRADAEGDTLIGKYQAITALDDLPSVQPMRKRGKWEGTDEWYHKCSNCKKDFHFYIGEYIENNNWNLCPNCGAKMVERKEV